MRRKLAVFLSVLVQVYGVVVIGVCVAAASPAAFQRWLRTLTTTENIVTLGFLLVLLVLVCAVLMVWRRPAHGSQSEDGIGKSNIEDADTPSEIGDAGSIDWAIIKYPLLVQFTVVSIMLCFYLYRESLHRFFGTPKIDHVFYGFAMIYGYWTWRAMRRENARS